MPIKSEQSHGYFAHFNSLPWAGYSIFDRIEKPIKSDFETAAFN
ncbi:MAG: hypothetical protein ACU85E_11595 [Gammaproteobacteria bacterium]